MYARYWDRYVEEDLHKVQAGRDDLEWPGDEWGTPELWEQYYRSMFVQLGGAETWRRAVEIGQGSGKYTVKVLRNPNVSVEPMTSATDSWTSAVNGAGTKSRAGA